MRRYTLYKLAAQCSPTTVTASAVVWQYQSLHKPIWLLRVRLFCCRQTLHGQNRPGRHEPVNHECETICIIRPACKKNGASRTTTLLPMIEFDPLKGIWLSTMSTVATPLSSAVTFPRSPACLSSSLGPPCCFLEGLKCAPALTQPVHGRSLFYITATSTLVTNRLSNRHTRVCESRDLLESSQLPFQSHASNRRFFL